MPESSWAGLEDFLEVVGLDEEPLGLYYQENKPASKLRPKPLDLPTREKEQKGEVEWEAVFDGFSCMMGHIWRARRKGEAAWFSAENFGCPGGAFYSGFLKPQTETVIHYVSSGFPGAMEGEYYLATPDECRAVFEYMDPRPAPAPYLVLKPLSLFEAEEEPETVVFFSRPESLGGLHQLVSFITGRAEVVRSPFGAGCAGLVAWPMHFLKRGEEAAVLGGWDPSARKYYKNDELSFTVTKTMFDAMLDGWSDSFLTRRAWRSVRKKIDRSKRVWGENKG
jgi:uncharacterized protein (DUF169 family)